MRGHNQGSVYYWTARKCWVAEITTEEGKRKKFCCKTEAAANRKLKEALRELEQGVLATGPQRKLGEYLVDWLENVHKSKLRLGTYINYKKLIGYVVAELGDAWLQKLTPEKVQAFYTKKLSSGLSSKVVHEIHGVLHLALKNAVRWGLIARNVCDLVTAPRIVSREMVPLTMEQANALMNHVRGHRLEVLLALAVVTGMRRGELLALRWADIDLKRSKLVVLHSVDFIAGHGYVEGKPKTAAGRRAVSLPAFLLEMLQVHRVQQLEQKSAVSDWVENDLVFPNHKGSYMHPTHMAESFKKLLEEAGLPPMRFHDLRHSAATILLARGVNIKVVSELLGHSDIVITLRTYGHLLPSMQGDAVDSWKDGFEDDNENGGVPTLK